METSEGKRNFAIAKSGVYRCIGKAIFRHNANVNLIRVARGSEINGEFEGRGSVLSGEWLIYANTGDEISFTTSPYMEHIECSVKWIAETPKDVDYATVERKWKR